MERFQKLVATEDGAVVMNVRLPQDRGVFQGGLGLAKPKLSNSTAAATKRIVQSPDDLCLLSLLRVQQLSPQLEKVMIRGFVELLTAGESVQSVR